MSRNLVELGRRALGQALPDRYRGIVNAGVGFLGPNQEPQRPYMWEAIFSSTGSGGNNIKLYCMSTAIPTRIVENVKRHYQGVEYGVSGRDTSPRIFRLSFWDNQDLEVYRFFNNWMSATSYGPESVKGAPYEYERDLQLKLKDTSDIQTKTTIILRNCRPTEIGEASLSYSESNLFTFDVLLYFTDKEIV